MNKNGLWSDIAYYVGIGLRLMWNVGGSMLAVCIWLGLMMFPAFIGMLWLMWVTVPFGLIIFFSVMAYIFEGDY